MNVTEKRATVTELVQRVTASNKNYAKYSNPKVEWNAEPEAPQQPEIELSPKAKKIQKFINSSERPFGCYTNDVLKLMAFITDEPLHKGVTPERSALEEWDVEDVGPKLFSAVLFCDYDDGPQHVQIIVQKSSGEYYDQDGEELGEMYRYATPEEIAQCIKRMSASDLEQFDFLF